MTDAGLIAICQQFAADELENFYRYVMAPEGLADAQDTLPDTATLSRIANTPATTSEGWQAKALAYSAWNRNAFDNPEDEQDRGSPLLAAILREMVGPARDAIMATLAEKYGPLPAGYTADGMWIGAEVPA